jgi:two-component system, chemotaxis family, protein-glutamate methylesterase/glutaminase
MLSDSVGQIHAGFVSRLQTNVTDRQSQRAIRGGGIAARAPRSRWCIAHHARTLLSMESSPVLEELGHKRDLVVIGASAGGVETLKRVVAGLPGGLPAAVCIVLHIAPGSPSALARILQRAGTLPCRAASDREPLRLGQILVAPPDHHLVVEDGHARLTVGPRENGHRPAVDVLFRSAATARHTRVIGVVLSGTRDDGAAGLAAIKSSGGAAIVQDPEDALYPGMPTSALAHVSVDAVVPAEQVAQTISSMVNGQDLPDSQRPAQPGWNPGDRAPLASVCPECGGILIERTEAGMPQWECHVGHRYSPTSLADAQGDRVEMALWTAVRMLRDRSALLHRMADQSDSRHQPRSAQRFRDQAEDASRQAELVREALAHAAAGTLSEVSEGDADQAVDVGGSTA